MPETQSYKLIIEDDEGRRSVVPIELGEVSIGRHDGSTIRLNERNISRQHARMRRDGEMVMVEDLDSYNGVWVNGTRVGQRAQVREGDIVRIGDFQLELRGEGLQRRTEETTQRTTHPEAEVTQPQYRMQSDPPAQAAPAVRAVEEPDVPRHEPTAIIRMDHISDVEAARRQGASIAGQKAKIICVSTQFAGREFEITKTEMVIGRTDENDIAIDHRSVSRHHAKIVASAGTFKVIDLKSANGTLINGEEYAQTDLKPGDLVELGHVKFRFVPPGGNYELTAEERAAVAGASAGATRAPAASRNGAAVDAVSSAASAEGNGLARAAAPLTRLATSPKATLWLGIGVAALFLLLLAVLLTNRSRTSSIEPVATATSQPTLQPMPTSGTVAPSPTPTGNPEVDKLMREAQAAAGQRRWKQAGALAQAAQALAPGTPDAVALAERSEREAGAQASYESAVGAVGHGDWAAAWDALGNVPDDSIYAQQTSVLVEQVRTALISEALNKANAALGERDFDTAEDLANEISDLDPQHAELARLRDEVDQGRRRAGRTRPKTVRATPKPKTKVVATPTSTPAPPVAPVEDVKTLFNDGIKALNGGQLQKSIDLFSKCVQIDKRFSNCYKALGIAYARARNGPKAAHYYELYLRTAPDAPDAEKVRELLRNYKERAN